MYDVIRSNRADARRETFQVDPSMQVRCITLNVSSLAQSIDFYQSVLGFVKVGKSSSDRAFLSTEGSSANLVELRQVKANPSSATKRAGLYHFAILLPERKFLADMLRNLRSKRDLMRFDGLADHLVSESIYIRDPDLIGIEIYSDRPRTEWNWDGRQIEMSTLPLNTDNLLQESTERGWKHMPSKTRIGHVHLHVNDLSKAVRFYHEILGLNLTATIAGAAFFAAGKYHHHIAANTWLGHSIAPASSESIGLNYFTLELTNEDEYAKLWKQLSKHGRVDESTDSSCFIRDMDGVRIQIQHN